jgi:hypothetical protein
LVSLFFYPQAGAWVYFGLIVLNIIRNFVYNLTQSNLFFMAVRYETEINNLVGHYWKVQILDADYVGAAADFVLADFELDRKSLANRWDLIWGAECSLSVYSTAANNLDTLISDILGADEGRFQVALYHKTSFGGTYAFYWIGLVLNDLSGGVDEAPQQSFTIVAVDGLGALKGIDYSIDDVTPIATASVATHLMNCLKKLPTASFFSSGDVFLKEATNYFESQMPTLAGSPVNWTNIPSDAFFEIDKNGIYKFKSCYDVLEILTNLFLCRLYFKEGCWRFYDIRAWETSASLTVRPWTFAGTLGTAASESVRYTIDGTAAGARISAQQFGNLPPLRKLSRIYKHDTARNLINGITVNTAAGLQNVLTITESGTEHLSVSGALTISASEIGSGAAYQTVYVKLRFQMKIGSFYLKRTVNNQSENNNYSNLEWVSTVAYVEYILVFGVQFLGGITLAVAFDTPALPNFVTGTLQVNLEKVYIQDLQQNNLSGIYNYSAVFASIYIEYVDGDAENERTYNVLNDTTAFFSEVAELVELPVGDKINAMTKSRLLVWNGSAFVDADSDWGRNTLSGTKPLIQLVLENIMAGQRTTIRKRSGEFMGRFDSCDVLAISGEYYLPLSVRFSCNDASYSGEWYKCGTYNDSGMAVGYVAGVVTGVDTAPSATPPSGSGAVLPTNVTAENGKLTITALSGADGFVVNDSSEAEAFKINDSGKVSSNNQMVVGGNEFTTGVLFELRSTTQGFLPPRVTATQRAAFESVVGLVVYQTDGTEGLYLYKSTGWELIG